MNKRKDMENLKKLIITSLFLALIIVMSFTPIGYLHIGAIEISLLAIPVAAGASILGVGGGAFLGLAFGVTSLIQCFGTSAFGTALMGINPLCTVIICIIPRILIGVFSALIYQGLRKTKTPVAVCSLLSYLGGALTNTFIFVGSFILLFGNTELYANLETQFAATNVVAFFAAFVGINGIVEAVASAVIGSALGVPLDRLSKKL